jgi:hypothetical protein
MLILRSDHLRRQQLNSHFGTAPNEFFPIEWVTVQRAAAVTVAPGKEAEKIQRVAR